MRVRAHVARVSDLRTQIREANESVSDWQKRDLWDEAQAELDKVRLFGDLVVAAFFAAQKAQDRESKRSEYAQAIVGGQTDRYRDLLEEWRHADPALVPFHWELEFPEVFERDRPGFDAIAGNPPFMGGTRISEQYGMSYFQWLTASFHSCQHHCDLVAYFFRSAYSHLRDLGCVGLIATKTIAQGDTREGGLCVVLSEGGQIYNATKRLPWPGVAAVTVSVVHISRNRPLTESYLDGRPVSRISAYLVNGSADGSPSRILSNPYFSLGSKIYGQGFLFADRNEDCTPIAVRERLLAEHPSWADRMPPYLGGEEINSAPAHKPKRYAIQLSDISTEAQLDNWPELKKIVEEKVKPERLLLGSNPNNAPLRRRWWAYQAHRPELYERISPRHRVLCCSRITQSLGFVFIPTDIVISEDVVVVDTDADAAFAALQSRPHEVWARFFASSLGDTLRYTPSDCYETFPFPNEWERNPSLDPS